MSGIVEQKDNKQELSTDINIITAEINSYKQIAGNSIFEIGRRLKHTKENKTDLPHGQWENWCRNNLNITPQHANRFIRVFEYYGNRTSMFDLGIAQLELLIGFTDEQLQKQHTILSTGEQKTVDDMTVKELREVKKALKEEQEKSRKLEGELKQERGKKPSVIVKEKEVIPEETKEEIKNLKDKIKDLQNKYNTIQNNYNQTVKDKTILKEKMDKMEIDNKTKTKEYEEIKKKYNELEKQLSSEDFELEKLRKENDKLQQKVKSDCYKLITFLDEVLKQSNQYLALQSIKAVNTLTIKNSILERIEGIENFINQVRDNIQCPSPQNNTINVEYSIEN
jgi:SMC interacting uncharacterized protein involved in chromosome segregation